MEPPGTDAGLPRLPGDAEPSHLMTLATDRWNGFVSRNQRIFSIF